MLPSWGRSLRANRGREEEEHFPGGFPVAGRRGDGASRPRGRGRGAVGAGGRAPRLAAGSGPAAACGSARRVAPARQALHSPSLHQRLREEGRDPSLAHFPPSQTRTLPRSLAPPHTRALAAAAPHLAPALPRLLQADAGAGPGRDPVARWCPEARGPGCSPAAPEVRARGARGRPAERRRGRLRAGRAHGPGRGGRGAGSGATAQARPSRAPTPVGRRGLFHVQTFPGAEPSPATSRTRSRGP